MGSIVRPFVEGFSLIVGFSAGLYAVTYVVLKYDLLSNLTQFTGN